METNDQKPKWYSIKEAAEYLDVGEPTLYRWMKENLITFRKVGDSTRFIKEDLDEMVKVVPSHRDVERVRVLCPFCHHDEMVEGHVQGTGLVYFRPQRTKFWTFQDSNVTTTARMCTRCGGITWFGDTAKLATLRMNEDKNHADNEKASPDTETAKVS